MQLANHLLAFFLIVAGPVWDWFETGALKANPSRRSRHYITLIIWLWIATAVACWANGFHVLTTLDGLGIQLPWLKAHPWIWWLLTILIVLIVLLQLVLPVVQVTVKYRKRPFLEPKQLEPLRFFLPASTLERRWFAALSLTAAFCEEVLFRGFMLRYLHTSPLHIGTGWAFLAAALVFGTHHLYQGTKGFLSTTAGGLVFTLMLFVTSNLWLAMAYHAALDLSGLLYWRPKPLDNPHS